VGPPSTARQARAPVGRSKTTLASGPPPIVSPVNDDALAVGLFEPEETPPPEALAAEAQPASADGRTKAAPPEPPPDAAAAALAGPAAAPEPSPAAPEPPLALYRRYRPDVFADVIGQDHVTEPLRRALANHRVNHAYLFSGPRGCGKTSSARILARALNCAEGPTPEPCGQCDSCRELATGGPGSIDVIEIDAASHGGVDDARDLRERAFFAPVRSRYKVYIVDEAHMVTTQGFNALLKLVEEPPPHVKFVFATTEPDKVIGTIRSRTHHYPFRLVPPRVLGDYLTGVCDHEGVAVEDGVIGLVVRAAGGSVRDALSLLDQLLGGVGPRGVEYAQASALLGYTPNSLLDEFVDALAADDAHGVFATVDKVVEAGQEPRRFAEDLLRRLRDLIIVGAVDDAFGSGLLDVPEDQARRYRSQAAGLGAGELTRAAEVLAEGLTGMRGTTAPRLRLELMCARLLLPGADVTGRGLHARLDRLERRLGIVPAGDGEAPGAIPTGGPAPGAIPTGRPATESVPTDGPATEFVPVRGPAAEMAPVGGPGANSPIAPPGVVPLPLRGPAQRGPSLGPTPPEPGADLAPHSGRDDSWAPAAGTDHPAPDPPWPAGRPRPAAPDQPWPASRQATALGRGDNADASASAPPRGDPAAFSAADVRQHWPRVLDEIKQRRKFTWFAVQQAQVTDVSGHILWLTFSNPGARLNFTGRGEEDIHQVLVDLLGADLIVRSRLESDPPPRAEGILTVVPDLPPPRPAASPDAAEPPPARPEGTTPPPDRTVDDDLPVPDEPRPQSGPGTAGDIPDGDIPDDVAPDDAVVSAERADREAEDLVKRLFAAELISAEDNPPAPS